MIKRYCKTFKGTIVDKFNLCVERTDNCWLWISGLDAHGYGRICHKGVDRKAHRLSYEIHKGEIPKGMGVLHRCDTPACVNPDHLFVGTQKDNTADMIRKGRGAKGSMLPQTRLSELDVIIIKEALREGFLQKHIAKYFNVHPVTISDIKLNRSWKHIQDGA